MTSCKCLLTNLIFILLFIVISEAVRDNNRSKSKPIEVPKGTNSGRSNSGKQQNGTPAQHGSQRSGTSSPRRTKPSATPAPRGPQYSGTPAQHGSQRRGNSGPRGTQSSATPAPGGPQYSGTPAQHGSQRRGNSGPRGTQSSANPAPRGPQYSGTPAQHGSQRSGTSGPHRTQPSGSSPSTSSTRMSSKDQTCLNENSTAASCFDYLILSLFWPPAYAYKQITMKKHSVRDNKINVNKWVIHGLWPAMDSRDDPVPETCSNRPSIYFSINRLQYNSIYRPTNILTDVKLAWFTILGKGYSTDEQFLEHEFKKHGKCVARLETINDDYGYFKTAYYTLYNSIQLGTILYNQRYRPEKDRNTAKLETIIKIIENQVGKNVTVITVPDKNIPGVYYLTEVHFCYDLSLKIKDCPDLSLSESVKNRDVTYLPSLPSSVTTTGTGSVRGRARA